MCGACSGTAPGSSVRIPNSPSSFVGHRPKPRKPGTAPLGSSGWSNRPFGSACHVSINASGTGAPSPSVTTPRIHTAPSVPSSTTVGPSSHGRPIDRYGPTVCEGVEGSFGPAWLICPPVFLGTPSPPQRTQPAAADSTRPIPTGLASEKILAHSSSAPCGTPAPDRTRERKDPRSLVLSTLRDTRTRPDSRAKRSSLTRPQYLAGHPHPTGLASEKILAHSSSSSSGFSNGVASLPRTTMSKRNANAHSGTVRLRSNDEINRCRAFSSGIELKIGSWKNSGSSGKYICVTSRWVNAVPNSEKWMCDGRQALSWLRHG